MKRVQPQYTVHWSSIDGPQYYVSMNDMECKRHGWDCECDCPNPAPTRLSWSAAKTLADRLNQCCTDAQTGEAWDCAPHRVRIVRVTHEG